MDPLVSVVIPVFNRADLIARTVETVTNQTYGNWELIIVDDHSSDDLLAALEKLPTFDRIKYVRHEVNKGVSAARNTGIETASGKYISILDSDDEWHPEKLERQVRCSESTEDPENVLCATRGRILYDDGSFKVIPERDMAPGERFDEFLFVSKQFTATSSLFFSRSLGLKYPFAEHLRQYEDYLFYMTLGSHGAKYVLVDQILTTYHCDDRPGRLGRRDNLENSQKFFVDAETHMSRKAQLAFQSDYFAPFLWQTNKPQSLGILIKAFTSGAIGVKQFGTSLLKCTLGQDRHERLREHYLSFKGVRRSSESA